MGVALSWKRVRASPPQAEQLVPVLWGAGCLQHGPCGLGHGALEGHVLCP